MHFLQNLKHTKNFINFEILVSKNKVYKKTIKKLYKLLSFQVSVQNHILHRI